MTITMTCCATRSCWLPIAKTRRIDHCFVMTSFKRQFLPVRQQQQQCRTFSSNHSLNENDMFNHQDTNAEGKLILVRHGQSIWNVTDPIHQTTARFTGWANVELTELGKQQAKSAGRALASYKYSYAGTASLNETNNKGDNDDKNDHPLHPLHIDCAVSSLLKRSKDTLDIILNEMDFKHESSSSIKYQTTDKPRRQQQQQQINDSDSRSYKIPIIHSWRLNERHYGSLVGLSKDGAESMYSKQTLEQWRHGWDVRPPPMDDETRMEWSKYEHCQCITIVKDLAKDHVSATTNTSTNNNNRRHHHDASTATTHHHGNNDKKPCRNRSTKMMEKRIIGPSSNSCQNDDDNSIHKTTATRRMIPASESLRDTCERVIPLWKSALAPRLVRGETILLVAHANTVKSLLSLLDPSVVTSTSFSKLKIPSAMPLMYRFRQPYYNRNNSNGIGDRGDKDATENENILPGGLVLVKPSSSFPTNSTTTMQENIKEKHHEEEFRHQLHGEWIQTNDIENDSFCTPHGEQHLEHEIA